MVQRYGDSYVYYTNVNPSTGELHRETSYVKEFAGVLVLDQQRVVSVLRSLPGRALDPGHPPSGRLMAFVACVRDLIAERGELAFPLLTGHPQFRSLGYYAFVFNQQHRDVLYRADDFNCDLEVVEDTKIVQRLLKAGLETENQQGWVSYRWLNPATDRVETKEAFVMKISLNGEDMVAGAGIYTGE